MDQCLTVWLVYLGSITYYTPDKDHSFCEQKPDNKVEILMEFRCPHAKEHTKKSALQHCGPKRCLKIPKGHSC